MIFEHFRATGIFDAAQGLSDLFNILLWCDDVQDFDARLDQALLSAIETPSEMVLEGLYKSKLQDSVQLQSVLALYDQENIRNKGQPSYSSLKTAVRLHIDQSMRARSCRARNEICERGMAKRKEPYVEGKVGECIQWKVTGQCSERNSCIFSHDPALGDRCEAQRQEGQHSSPALDTRARTDGEKVPGKRESSSDVSRRIPCSSRVSELQVQTTMRIWKKMLLSTC